jgi:energy-converting hydrogenase A subunit M
VDQEELFNLSPKYLRASSDRGIELCYLRDLFNAKFLLHPEEKVFDLEPIVSVRLYKSDFRKHFKHGHDVGALVEV